MKNAALSQELRTLWWYHMNNHRFNQNLMIDIQIEIWWVLSIYPSFWNCFVLVRSFDMSLCRKLFKNVWFTQKVSVHWGLQFGQLVSSHPNVLLLGTQEYILPHLGCQAENANEDLKISSDYTKAMVYVLKRQWMKFPGCFDHSFFKWLTSINCKQLRPV